MRVCLVQGRMRQTTLTLRFDLMVPLTSSDAASFLATGLDESLIEPSLGLGFLRNRARPLLFVHRSVCQMQGS